MSNVRKYPITCAHCDKFVGFQLEQRWLPNIYCYACEDAVTHKEEIRLEHLAQYRRLAAQS